MNFCLKQRNALEKLIGGTETEWKNCHAGLHIDDIIIFNTRKN